MEKGFVSFLNWITPKLRRLAGRNRLSAAPTDGWALGTTALSGSPGAAAPVALEVGALDRHVYVLGASGSGKSRLLQLLVRQHLQRRAGCSLIDPHGDLVHEVMAYLSEEAGRAGGGKEPPFPPLYLVEPFQEDGIVGLNPLNPGGGLLYPHIGELVGIFRRFWGNSWGPRMEECWRQALLALALADGLTLVEVAPFLTDPAFRAQTLTRVGDEAVRAYWTQRYETLSEAARAAVAEPVLNKMSALLADPRIRAMLGQRDHRLDLRRLMDTDAWLFFNCSKGQLRDAAFLLGSFVVAQLQAAALSRADQPERERRPFTLVVDEFQNFRGDDFETILSESRKYRLRLVLAHQSLSQLDPPLQSAILSNVATHLLFAVSPQDAAVITRGLRNGPALAQMLTHLPVGHAVLHRRGEPAVPFRVHSVLPPPVPEEKLSAYMAALRRRHGRPLAEIEAEMQQRLTPPAPPVSPATPTTARALRGRKRGRGHRGTQSAEEGTLTPPVRPPQAPEFPYQEADDE